MNIKLLKQKDFFLLMFGNMTSLIGTSMQNFALALYVLAITHSTIKFASVTAITIIPKLIFGPISGVLADRFNRKGIMIGTDLVSGIVVLIYSVVFYIKGNLNLIDIYMIVIILTTTSVIDNPAVQTVIPSIMKKNELIDANSINTLLMTISDILALTIGAILYDNFGIGIIFILNSISFIISAISEIFINIPKDNVKNEKTDLKIFMSDFKEGMNYIKGENLIFNLLFIMIFINFAFNPIFKIGLPYISTEVLSGNGMQYSMLRITIIISGIIGSIISGRISKKFGINKLLFWSGIAISVAIGLLAVFVSKPYLNIFATSIIPFITVIIICFIIMMIATLCNIVFETVIQKTVPLNMMGRIQSVISMVCTIAVPLGELFFGAVVDVTNPALAIGISSSIILMTIILFGRRFLYKSQDQPKF
ncbi:MFS transporter [Acidilutibacter cellobiosedens]|jgi:MFS family permease|uniref:MFS transporter n=1 Tax=Acidilutibacter cellobiosedens TaxID=2507161 RepID=A0A410QEL9_9FIRM|nr:MFS transporter [Acidilutibacter cellobiosedens]QAT62364.1 MFS transporter [Acidilutibacter cellobiosedens]